MVAKADRVEKSKPGAGNKVSKPLMEKKRRARINKCLEHLKSLLESYYSTSIRKRKLEKADILELTVNHLRNLQKLHNCAAAAASDLSPYHSGFRRCLANVDQYLLTADHVTGSDRWMLSQLSASLCRSRGPEDGFSTTDSGPGDAGTRDAVQSTTPSSPTEAARQAPGERRVIVAAPAENTHEGSSRNKKLQSVGHRDVVANAAHSVWRPW